tara:strand:- start:573 stop:1061 length:489 start_codon:yes stop_codon:yes gene_type:complete
MTEELNNNRKYWDALKETDPRFTKKINKGFGDLTTIDPQWQIMKMTETFGPVGEGWNYTVDYKYLELKEPVVIAEVKVAHKKLANGWDYYGAVSSTLKLFKKNGTYDDEAPKKCMTDALTKAFSHLGLCSDIFMGLYDNNKYVEKLEEKYSNVDKSKVKKVS